ncbi:MAG: hypothetical protein ACK4RF_05955 [Cyclobacteriaceae bacterium]
MRLGQLARRLNIRPSDVVAALPAGTVFADYNSNTRLSDEQVKEIVQFFAPADWQVIISELLNEGISADDGIMVEQPVAEPFASTTTLPPNAEVISEVKPDQPEQTPEIIKAPKIELPGLKVVGKIDLPEKKIKETPAKQIADMPVSEKRHHRPERDNRNYQKKNPVTLARERQLREQEKQKRIEEELKKQKRTRKYQEKVARHKRVKPANTPSNKAVEVIQQPEPQLPKTAWGKFKQWLFRD